LLAAAAQSSVPPQRTSSGDRLRLSRSDAAERLVEEFAQRDKACCPFLEFAVEAEGRELVLEMTGPPEARDILALCAEVARQGAARSSPA
jgi:hypothetical protein